MCGCYCIVLFDTYFIKTENDSEYNFISYVKLYSNLVNVIITYKHILQRFQMNNMVIRI